jgi:hypothetical protein
MMAGPEVIDGPKARGLADVHVPAVCRQVRRNEKRSSHISSAVKNPPQPDGLTAGLQAHMNGARTGAEHVEDAGIFGRRERP